jgi:hypothetical protein
MAAAVTDTSVTDDLLNCSICLEQFTRPRHLPCLHTFCQKCLSDYIDSRLKGGVHEFPCPLCRKVTSVPGSDKPKETWGEQFPSNHLVEALLHSISVRQSGKQCDPCQENSKIAVAMSFCSECTEALCERCTETHQAMKITRHHKVISIEEARAMPRSLAANAYVSCPVHMGESMKVFCVDHNKPCCNTCVATQHRKCDNVATIEDLAIHIRESKEHEAMLDHFTQRASHMGKINVIQTINIEKVEEQHKQILKNNIKSVREKCNKMIDELESSATDSLAAVVKKELALLRTDAGDSEVKRDTYKADKDVLDAAAKYGCNSTLFLAVREAKFKCSCYETDTKQILDSVCDVQIVFTQN